jgi:SnoaL-like domain
MTGMTELHSADSARIALRALVDEYALASDTADTERFGSLFTPDAEFITSLPGSTESVTLRGRDQLKYGPSGNQMFERTFHAVHNHIADIDGNRAKGLTYCTARHLLRKPDGTLEVIVAPIQYRDEYELTDQGWKFSRRELEWTWIERIPAEPPAPWW